jgi:hypothetical protein
MKDNLGVHGKGGGRSDSDVAARGGNSQEVEVQVIAFGNDVAWVGLPGEILSNLGSLLSRHRRSVIR